MFEDQDAIKEYKQRIANLGYPVPTKAVREGLQLATQMLAVGVPLDQLEDIGRRFAQEYAQYGTKRIDRGQQATRHRMTSGLVGILVNIAETVHAKNQNDIHLYKDVTEVCGPQAYSMLSNITKLRFHALVFKVKGEDGKQIKGRWGITKRGGQFLRGEIEIEEFALTQGNRVVGREGKLVGIRALRPEGPLEFEQREDVTYTEAPAPHTPAAVSWLKDED